MGLGVAIRVRMHRLSRTGYKCVAIYRAKIERIFEEGVSTRGWRRGDLCVFVALVVFDLLMIAQPASSSEEITTHRALQAVC